MLYKTEQVSENDWKKFWDENLTLYRVKNIKHKERVIQIYDTKIEDNRFTIIMEYGEGDNLKNVIGKKGKLSVEEAIYIIKCILEVLDELHSFADTIIHKDLKPENIIVSNDLKDIKLLDFGISTSISKKNDEFLTNEKETQGTWPYLTPQMLEILGKKKILTFQQIQNKKKMIGRQFDIYSLGMIFYQMLIGKLPLELDNVNNEDALYRTKMYDIPIISSIYTNISPALENIIIKMLGSKYYKTTENEQKKPLMYNNIKQILHDIKLYESGAASDKLILPAKDRNFYIPEKIDNKQDLKFYQETWFVILFSSVSIVLVVLIFLLYFI